VSVCQGHCGWFQHKLAPRDTDIEKHRNAYRRHRRYPRKPTRLEAVRIDIARRHVDRTINLGDCVSGPLWPREVCDLLMASDDLTIRGNHGRWVSEPDLTSMGASDRYAYSQLNQGYRSWLAALPTSANADHGILACHGTPTSDNRYLVEEASGGRLVRASLAVIKERLGAAEAAVLR
jgi:hypothetical protein